MAYDDAVTHAAGLTGCECPVIRFVEMVIDQLTARGVMEASALYEPPFSNLHGGGPEALFGGKKNVIEGIFHTLKAVQSGLMVKAG